MDSLQCRAANTPLIAGMLRGLSWQEAVAQATFQIREAPTSPLRSQVRIAGAAAL